MRNLVNTKKNAESFSGFADIYDSVRPAVPKYPIDMIVKYMGYSPKSVVDIGCGTGLSTLIWKDRGCDVIGIEPNDDMLSIAKTRESSRLKFSKGFGHQTNLNDSFADIITCSQAFHWMEPNATLDEVNRILKKGGAFATIDCDWPPIAIWQADKLYETLHSKVMTLEQELPEIKTSFIRYSKENHLENIKRSGYFQYAREVVFANTEICSPQRFVGLLLSQGSLQSILMKQPNILANDIQELKKSIERLFNGNEMEIDFSYRMRIAIK